MPPRGTDRPGPVGPTGPAGVRRAPPKPGRDTAKFDFFFYGTLCDDDVRECVVGRACAVEAATLDGYEAVPVERGRFPILLAQRGRVAAGVLCRGLSLTEAARLGLYEHEGRDYTARRFPIKTSAEQLQPAWVFVPLGTLRRGPGKWDLAEWQRFAKAEFLARVRQRIRLIEARDLDPLVELWRGRAVQREA